MSGESFIQNFDMTLFYEKRVQDYNDAQRSNGRSFKPLSLRSRHDVVRWLYRDSAVCGNRRQRCNLNEKWSLTYLLT